MKLTSPGILLILAIIAAAGIFLLDLTYLRPSMVTQEQAAMRDQVGRVEHSVRLMLQEQAESLQGYCRALVCADATGDLRQGNDTAGFFRQLAGRTLAGSKINLAWLTDDTARVRGFWSPDPSKPRPRSLGGAREIGPDSATPQSGSTASGITRLDEQLAVFARCPVGEPTASGGNRQLWVGRFVDAAVLKRITAAIGAKLIFVRADALPDGADGGVSGPHAFWSTGKDNLTIAWLANDETGRAMGYFQADIPVTHIRRQATAARRTILIILSLSVGLAILVILGTNILISGPIVRLLRRLHQMESGEVRSSASLTSDLHGEPLVLARKLESAFKRLSHLSRTDQMTGLANRRHFEEVLDRFYYQARRYNRPLSVMVMDIDYFKAINDSGGHQAGDELLKIVAAEIEKACRKADLPARFGGDEFTVLMPETGIDDAAIVAERILSSVAQQHISAKSLELNATISLGLTDLNSGEIDSPDAMVALADKALYAAKEQGRNRFVMAHDLMAVNCRTEPENRRNIDQLHKKLSGMDIRFKNLFLHAMEEIMQLLEQRNPHMADHARKVRHYAVLIAQEMELPRRLIDKIRIAAMLHDIGMFGMPDSILLARGALDEQQAAYLRKHPLLSVRIMEGMEFLEQEIPAVRYHHERYDGKGYPEGIAAGAIPLTARILAVADTFDAMTTSRTFRTAKSKSEALEELKRATGTQFDPVVVDAFMAVVARLGDKLMDLSVDAEQTAPAEVESLSE